MGTLFVPVTLRRDASLIASLLNSTFTEDVLALLAYIR